MLKAYIALAELLAACTPIFVYPKVFVGASITSHVDSMTALSSLVLGAGRSPELSHFSTALHCLLSLHLHGGGYRVRVILQMEVLVQARKTQLQERWVLSYKTLNSLRFFFRFLEPGPVETLALFSSCLNVA